MNIYVDIDGTLTADPENLGGAPILARIVQVRELSKSHSIFLWSGRGQEYVCDFAQLHAINCVCLPKPDVIVDDNPTIRPNLKVREPDDLWDLA